MLFVDNRLLLTSLCPSMAYNVVVEARKMRRHDAISEGKTIDVYFYHLSRIRVVRQNRSSVKFSLLKCR